MVGQMAALLIGDAGFRTTVSERGLQYHGILPLGADSLDDVAAAVGGHHDDVHVVLLGVTASADELAFQVKRAKTLPRIGSVPLITVGDDTPVTSATAIRAGAFHHLPQSCDHELLRAAIGAAVQVSLRLRQLDTELRARSEAISLLTTGFFRFRTPEEANNLAIALSSAGPHPQRLALGLLELLLNAIEHGNLGIGSEEKSRLRAENRFAEEVEERLALPENQNKFATLQIEHDDAKLTFTITDDGSGFDWKNYSSPASSSAPVLHGRGILLARTFAFDRVEYEGNGNRVVAYVDSTIDDGRR